MTFDVKCLNFIWFCCSFFYTRISRKEASELEKRKCIGIKVGSEEVVKDGFIPNICRQIATLMARYNVFLVTSGAIANDPKKSRKRNLRAAIGQARLISKYIAEMAQFKIEVAQMVFTARDLNSPRVFLSTIDAAFKDGKVLPVINANDVVDSHESDALGQYRDNDRLFFRVVTVVDADIPIIGFAELGLLDNEGNVVREVRREDMPTVRTFIKKGSALGHGDKGMDTKTDVLSKLAHEYGKPCLLVQAHQLNVFIEAVEYVQGHGEPVGTLFL